MGKPKFEQVKEDAPEVASMTEVAKAEPTAVSAEVKVQGLQVRFATLMPYYTVCDLPQDVHQECKEGDLVLKVSKNQAHRLGGSGRGSALRAVVVDGKQGFLEGCPMGSGALPRAWVVGRPKSQGSSETLKTLEDCRAAAQAEAPEVPFYRFEDYSRAMNPIPQHYIAECFYLELLVKLPDTFTGDVTLVKVGGSLYTPARILFKKFDPIKVRQFFSNIQVRESMKHRGDKDWKWTPYGQYLSVFTEGAQFTRPNGAKGTIWTPRIEAALGESGSLYVPDDEEREDLTKFYMAASATTMTAEEAAEVGNGDL